MNRRPHRDRVTGSHRTGCLAASIVAHMLILAWITASSPPSARDVPAAGQPMEIVIRELSEPDTVQARAPAPTFTPSLPVPSTHPVQIEPTTMPGSITASTDLAPSSLAGPIPTDATPLPPPSPQPVAIVSSSSDWLESSVSFTMSDPTQTASPLQHQNPVPKYPRLARERGWQGTAWLRVEVKADGTPGRIEILKTSGHALLDETSLRAVRSWRFNPATRNNQAVVSWIEVPIRFELVSG